MRLGLGLGFSSGVNRWSPSRLFASGEPGGWYDIDPAYLYQDSAGTTPVTAPGQTVGMVLDRSKGLVLGPELVTNGDFSNGSTGWTVGTNWSVGSGVASKTAGAGGSLSQSAGIVNGRFYRVSFVLTVSGGTVWVNVGSSGSFSNAQTVGGTINLIVAANGTTGAIEFQAGSGAVATIDNISVRELPGNHLTQSTLSNRAIYGIEPFGGRRNLLTYTETGTGWLADSTTFATGLPGVDGFTSGSFSFSNGSTNYPRAGVEATSGVQITCSAWIWVTSGTVSVRPAAYYSGAWQLLGAGDLTVTSTPQRFTWTYTPTTNTSFGSGFALRMIYSGGTGTVRVSGAQLETGSTATAYQRVTDQWNVTEAGRTSVGYLQFDGSDDWLVSPTITPGIDKAQVFAGVRKLSDAGFGVVAELSAAIGSNNGALSLYGNIGAGYTWQSKGTAASSANANTLGAAPITNVLTGIGDIAADTAILRANGVQAATSTTDQGTGNYLAYPLYVGRRGGTTLPYNGRIYSLIVRFGANLDAATIAATEAYVNSKTGAY